MTLFPKVFWDFQKWTFIFVHFRISEKGFGAKNCIFGRWELWGPTNLIYILEELKERRTYVRSVDRVFIC